MHEFTVKHYATVSTRTKKHNGVNRSQTNQKIRSAFLSGRPHKSNTYWRFFKNTFRNFLILRHKILPVGLSGKECRFHGGHRND